MGCAPKIFWNFFTSHQYLKICNFVFWKNKHKKSIIIKKIPKKRKKKRKQNPEIALDLVPTFEKLSQDTIDQKSDQPNIIHNVHRWFENHIDYECTKKIKENISDIDIQGPTILKGLQSESDPDAYENIIKAKKIEECRIDRELDTYDIKTIISDLLKAVNIFFYFDYSGILDIFVFLLF